MFRAIRSDNFPPFGDFRIDFPPVLKKPDNLAEVHLFTGVNGTGKTRLLSVLASMLGHHVSLIRRLKSSNHVVQFFAADEHSISAESHLWTQVTATATSVNWQRQGSLFQWSQNVPAFAYNGLAYVADAQIAVMAGVQKPNRGDCLSFTHPERHSQELLQSVANLKVQAAMDIMNAGNAQADSRSTALVRAFEQTISEITGQHFQFSMTNYPNPILSSRWANKELPFDVLPDGLRSIIGWMVDAVVMFDAWLQGKGNLRETEVVFLLDEIESHLHPVWQRRILPAFQRLFPRAQIFVATHSPFVISSLNHGWIHRLKMGDNGRAVVEKPIPASEGDSYISVIEGIMGLEEWYDPETEKLLTEFRDIRNRAYHGDMVARTEAISLAERLGKRSMELSYIMGKELGQMERQLKNVGSK